MLRTIIVEDEFQSQELLSYIIQNYCPSLDLVGLASDQTELENVLNTAEPDLVFMDINLKDGNAFKVLDRMENMNFKIIFTTALQNFAIKAYEYQTVDYILKPYSPKDIIKAVDKARKEFISIEILNQLNRSINKTLTINVEKKISIRSMNGIRLINVSDINRLEADGAYCRVFINDESSEITCSNLKEMEAALPISSFFRVHNKHLINIHQIRAFNNEDGGYLLMNNEDKVPVSRRKKQALLARLDDL